MGVFMEYTTFAIILIISFGHIDTREDIRDIEQSHGYLSAPKIHFGAIDEESESHTDGDTPHYLIPEEPVESEEIQSAKCLGYLVEDGFIEEEDAYDSDRAMEEIKILQLFVGVSPSGKCDKKTQVKISGLNSNERKSLEMVKFERHIRIKRAPTTMGSTSTTQTPEPTTTTPEPTTTTTKRPKRTKRTKRPRPTRPTRPVHPHSTTIPPGPTTTPAPTTAAPTRPARATTTTTAAPTAAATRPARATTTTGATRPPRRILPVDEITTTTTTTTTMIPTTTVSSGRPTRPARRTATTTDKPTRGGPRINLPPASTPASTTTQLPPARPARPTRPERRRRNRYTVAATATFNSPCQTAMEDETVTEKYKDITCKMATRRLRRQGVVTSCELVTVRCGSTIVTVLVSGLTDTEDLKEVIYQNPIDTNITETEADILALNTTVVQAKFEGSEETACSIAQADHCDVLGEMCMPVAQGFFCHCPRGQTRIINDLFQAACVPLATKTIADKGDGGSHTLIYTVSGILSALALAAVLFIIVVCYKRRQWRTERKAADGKGRYRDITIIPRFDASGMRRRNMYMPSSSSSGAHSNLKPEQRPLYNWPIPLQPLRRNEDGVYAQIDARGVDMERQSQEKLRNTAEVFSHQHRSVRGINSTFSSNSSPVRWNPFKLNTWDN